MPEVAQAAGHKAQITVGPNVQVSTARAQLEHAEVVLAADPNHPGRLLAGSMVLNPGMGPSVVGYASTDGGKTWKLTLERKAKKGGPHYYDPAVAFGPDGSAYFADLPRLHLEIARSRDGGQTWDAPFLSKEPSDRPFLVVDCTNGKFRGQVYCNYNLGGKLALHRSRDGARTFDPPKTLTCKGSAQGRGPVQAAVLSDGTLVLPYRVLTRATDLEFSLRVQRSNTGGESFLDEQFLRDYREGEPRLGIARCVPMLAVDPGSRAFKDRLYLVWTERTDAGLRVMLLRSKDKGVSWSEPVVLSGPAGPQRGAKETGHYSFLSSVAVNRAGVVAVSWYDARLHEGKIRCDVRLRISRDGGETWLPSARVTDVTSGYEKGTWVGDTAGLAADAAGAFYPLWIDSRTGVRQVFTARVAVQ
jgi:hypothetical protein